MNISTGEFSSVFCCCCFFVFRFTDGSNNGLEAFVTPGYDLVIAVYNKKEFCTLTVTDTRLQDGLWVKLDSLFDFKSSSFVVADMYMLVKSLLSHNSPCILKDVE